MQDIQQYSNGCNQYSSTNNEYEYYVQKQYQVNSSPAIVVNYPDVYVFKAILNLVGSIKKDLVVMTFYNDRIVMDEHNSSKNKQVNITIRTEDILGYSYAVRNIDGSLADSYSIRFNTDDFLNTLKADGKKEELLFTVSVNQNGTNNGISVIKDRRVSLALRVPTSPMPSCFETVENYYDRYVSDGRIPNSKLSAGSFSFCVKNFKLERNACIEFVLDRNSLVTMQNITGTSAASLPNDAYAIVDSDASVIAVEPLQVGEGWISSRVYDKQVVILEKESMDILINIPKLGSQNVVKIYMAGAYPLVISFLFNNCGTCAFSFSGDVDPMY